MQGLGGIARPEPQQQRSLWPRTGDLKRRGSAGPVTPGDRGFEFVAPVKVPVNRHLLLSTLTSDRNDETAKKRPETRSRGGGFKPIQAQSRLTAKAPCDYTKRPDVKAAHAEKRRQGVGASTGDRGLSPRAASYRVRSELTRVEDCFRRRTSCTLRSLQLVIERSSEPAFADTTSGVRASASARRRESGSAWLR